MRIIALSALLCISWNTFIDAQNILPYDILITELMVDPYPPVGLPNFEWVEIYNRSQKSIDLAGYHFSSGTKLKPLPSIILNPGAYALIVDDEDAPILEKFGPTLGLPTFPSLTNTGDLATIWGPANEIIHEINYSRKWYQDKNKDDGGYTLELINPLDPCLGMANWKASEDVSGGTPGRENSSWLPQQVTSGLKFTSLEAESPTTIRVQFDRIPSLSINEQNFEITNGIHIIDIVTSEDDPLELILELGRPLSPGILYTFSLLASALDCEQRSSGLIQSAPVIIPLPLKKGDLVINEILFNPFPNESDYVEIYNTTANYLDLSDLSIANLKSDGSGTIRKFPDHLYIAPHDYMVISEAPQFIPDRYPNVIQEKVLLMDLPSFNNTSGNVTLLVQTQNEDLVIDAMKYEESMHHPFIDDAEGVALERRSITWNSNDKDNWKSAASSVGYGTPTYPNSQGGELYEKPMITLKTKSFYPTDLNRVTELEILFELDDSNYIGSIQIFDLVGRLIKHIANGQLLGMKDHYFWDGKDDNGLLAKAGVYIIFIRLINSEGALITKKLPCVLSRAI